jgi:hypothetical protein
MLLSLLIQDAIEQHIAPLSRRSLNQNGDPYGSDSKLRVQSQHWIAYQGSSYPGGATSYDAGYSQQRELEYQHYVEAEDFRRDFRKALKVHEQLMGAIAGFCPKVAGVRSPLRLTSDGIVSAKVENEVVYRYRATYQILCNWVAGGLAGLEDSETGGELFIPSGIVLGVFRSPVDQVAVTEVSPKFAEVEQ